MGLNTDNAEEFLQQEQNAQILMRKSLFKYFTDADSDLKNILCIPEFEAIG